MEKEQLEMFPEIAKRSEDLKFEHIRQELIKLADHCLEMAKVIRDK